MGSTQGRRGRPSKPYVTSWGEPIAGLRREADGRWRNVSTREAFTETDERLAIQRFRANQDRQADAKIDLRYHGFESLRDFTEALNRSHVEMTVTSRPNSLPEATLAITVPSHPFWTTVRRLLIERPKLVADMVGIPQLASLADLPMPRPSLKLQRLLEIYMGHSHAKPESKAEASRTFTAFMAATKAQTLSDLTVESLKTYRDTIRSAGHTPGTVSGYFGRVKNIIRFAKSEGEDSSQIDAALSRLAILKAPPDKATHQPTPISRDDFHAICKAAADWHNWQARLIAMLNLCLHFDECLDVEWSDFDLKAGTFCTTRNKRGRVIRAAVLWPETITALNAIKRTGSPYVFVSKNGTRFNAKGQWKTWDRIREAAKLPDVQLDDIRDGAYSTAAAAAGVDEKFARLLAGHASHGLQDRYVKRNPSIVRPASDAVYDHYFGPQ